MMYYSFPFRILTAGPTGGSFFVASPAKALIINTKATRVQGQGTGRGSRIIKRNGTGFRRDTKVQRW